LAPVFGREVFAIRGESMSPDISIGSLTVVDRRTVPEIRAGDVVTWRGDNGVWVTHRATEVFQHDAEWYVRTQGDANDSADAVPVPERSIVGVVEVSLPLGGYALTMLSTPTGLISWLSFGLALLALDSLLAGMAPRVPGTARALQTPMHPGLRRRLRRPLH